MLKHDPSFGLIKVACNFASEIEPYALFSGDLKYLFGTGMIDYNFTIKESMK